MTKVLEIHDIKKHFGGIRAVDGVSFDVNKGEILGLIRKARVIAWAAVGLVLWARNAGAATDARSSTRSSPAS